MRIPNFASKPFLNSRPVFLVAALAALLVAILAFVNVRLYLQSNQVLAGQLALRSELNTKVADLESQVSERLAELNQVPWRSLGNRVQGLNVVLKGHAFSWLQLLDDLGRTMPYGVRIVSISPDVSDEGVRLNFNAVARSRDDLLEFLDNLIADPRFSRPFPSGESWPEGSSSSGYEFSVTVDYEPGGSV